jgi:RHS repeat-associated protein
MFSVASFAFLFTSQLALLPSVFPATIPVNCNSQSLQPAIEAALPGDTVSVSGTCNENLLVRNEKQRITIDGAGAGVGTRATVNAPSSGVPALNVRGKGILIQNFAVNGGSDGINVNRGSNAVLHNNLIQNSTGSGIVVQDLAFAVITSNTITNHPGDGILITETSTARIGFNSDGDLSPSPNTIQSNAGRGITIGNSSGARIVGNSINSNGQDGIGVLRESNAEVSGNSISANGADGILVSENSNLRLVESPEGGIFIQANSTVQGLLNGGFGLRCQTGSVVDGVLGTLNGSSGVSNLLTSCIAGTLDQSPVAVADNTSTGTNAQAIFSVTANDSDPDSDPLTVTAFTQGSNGTVSCTGSGICTYTPNSNFSGVDTFSYTISDGKGGFTTTTATITVTPPDPSVNAPAVDRSVATTVAKATEFLYTGANAIQTGVVPGTIQPIRAAVLRGRVLTREGSVLPGATVTILNSPQYGQTVSRNNGFYDLAVNGGGPLTINYIRPGYLPAQRQITVPWQDYVTVPDVALIPLDTRVTTITPNASFMQVHQSNMSTDSDGSRKATLLFPAGTTAQMVMPNGSTQPLTNLSVRASEYTVGPNGPMTMPGILPPTSGYTYAVEFSVDQAVSAGAALVTFNQPLPTYVENFLNFPVGTAVPVGYYDKIKGAWVAAPNGRVIKIVGITNNLADLDVTGDNIADTGTALTNLGITNAERQRLATLYSANTSVWRVPITHFTPWDYNWPFGPPNDAKSPGESGASAKSDDALQCAAEASGSIIECENQVLGERVAIVGTPYTLNYRSDRVPGRLPVLDLTLSGNSLPSSLESIAIKLSIVGQSVSQTFPPAPNQKSTFVWNGKDSYDRPVQGGQTVTGSIDYNYPAIYQTPGEFQQSFANFGSGTIVSNDRAALTVSLSQPIAEMVGEGITDGRSLGLGGWTLSVHHSYDPSGTMVSLGSGRRQRSQSIARVIHTVAGNGTEGSSGDGGPAIQAQLDNPLGVAVGPDGALYIVDDDRNRVRRVGTDGIITTVAGTGIQGFSGDGGLAIQAELNDPDNVAVGSDGSLYITDSGNHRVRRVGPNGIITTVAGTGVQGFSGDNALAIQAQLNNPSGVVVAPDGSIYMTDTGNARVRRVGPDGIITTVAGTGVQDFGGDGGPATQAQLDDPSGIAVGPDGSLYIADRSNNRIRRIGPDGIITTVAGIGESGFTGDGDPAIQAELNDPDNVAVGPDGSLYIADRDNNRVRRVGPEGIIATIAGNGIESFGGDGGSATQASLGAPSGVAVAPDGSIYIGDRNNRRVRRVGPVLPGFTASDVAVTSEDGGLLYRFDAFGRHLQTLHVLTGAPLFEFIYDSAGRLSQVIEKTGGTDNVTTVQRDINGNPTKIIGPYGQETLLSVDGNGFLSNITNPAGESYQISSTATGLLTSLTDPRGKTSTYGYDAHGRLTSALDPAGGSQTLARTAGTNFSQVTRTTGLSRTTKYKVEDLPGDARMRTITLPDNTENVGEESLNAGANTFSAADGTITNMQLGPDPRFDMQAPFAKTLSLILPSDATTNITASQTVALSDPGNPLSMTSLTRSSALNGGITTTTYTQSTKTALTTTPVGRTSSITIDTFGRTVSSQVTGLNAANMTYDANGRLATLIRGSGPSARTLTFGYNPGGFVSSITDPLGRVVQFNYDGAGRVTSKVFPDGRIASFTYDLAGNLATLTPPGRPASSITYSDRDEPIELTPPAASGSGPTNYTFNLDKQLMGMSRPDGRSVTLTYDSGGRISMRNLLTGGLTTGTDTYSYDGAGRLSTIAAASGIDVQYGYDGSLLNSVAWSGALTGDVSFAYDESLRLANESVNGADMITFAYDNDDLLTGAGSLTISRDPQTGFVTGTTLGNVSTTTGYTAFAEVASHSASASGSPIFSNTFTRDKLGRITQKVETIGGITSTYDYTYHTAGQLNGLSKNSVSVEAYGYDDNGNRTSTTLAGILTSATYDNQDRLLSFGPTTFLYSGAGDLQSKTTSGQTTTYQYDQLGNLLSVTPPVGSTISYVIDGRGRRMGKKVNNVLVKGFLYGDTLRPAAELDGAGNVISRFVYAESHAPIYMIKGGSTYQIIKDEVSSVRLVVDTVTGTITQRIDYDSFGNVTLDTNPGFQPFGFGGGIYDPDTGLVRMGARDYDSITGRWTTKDPKGIGGGDTNLYRYVHNDPVNLVDPMGASAWDTAVGFMQQAKVESFVLLNPALGPAMALDSLSRWLQEAAGFPPAGPSLEDTLAGRGFSIGTPVADYLSEDYARGAFVASCLGAIAGAATGVAGLSKNPGGIGNFLKGIGSAVDDMLKNLLNGKASIPVTSEADDAAAKYLDWLRAKGNKVGDGTKIDVSGQAGNNAGGIHSTRYKGK